jgi:hypothetical protein
VRWAFPSFSRTACTRWTAGVAPLCRHLDVPAALCSLCSIAFRRSSSLSRFCLIAIYHCTGPRLSFLPFGLCFLYCHSRISTVVISPNSFSCIPACLEFLAVFLRDDIGPSNHAPPCSSTCPEHSCVLTYNYLKLDTLCAVSMV